MKSKDQVSLEESYNKVQEGWGDRIASGAEGKMANLAARWGNLKQTVTGQGARVSSPQQEGQRVKFNNLVQRHVNEIVDDCIKSNLLDITLQDRSEKDLQAMIVRYLADKVAK